jgi:redox-sensitive bicupin YhaK (pirin superfamily)
MSKERPLPIDSIPARVTTLGSLKILRALPRRRRRTVGPWCFLDRYGPIGFTSEKAMDVAPHPHMGLQTVSWLTEGEIVHNDSLGSEALMHAGQLNLMTSGRGIAHSEETPKRNSGRLSGVQLWVALPDDHRNVPPVFDHYASLPVLDFPSCTVTLITGEMGGSRSPARTFSPIVGAEIALHDGETAALPLNQKFEHALLVLSGDVALDGQPLEGETLHYLGLGRDELHLQGRDARVLLIGGEPFREPILIWWNFVARTKDEMAAARQDWAERRRFGEVTNYRGERIHAPEF